MGSDWLTFTRVERTPDHEEQEARQKPIELQCFDIPHSTALLERSGKRHDSPRACQKERLYHQESREIPAKLPPTDQPTYEGGEGESPER